MQEFTAQCIGWYLRISIIIWSVGWMYTFLFIATKYKEIQGGLLKEQDLDSTPFCFFRLNKAGKIKISILYSLNQSFGWIIYPYKFIVLLGKQIEL